MRQILGIQMHPMDLSGHENTRAVSHVGTYAGGGGTTLGGPLPTERAAVSNPRGPDVADGSMSPSICTAPDTLPRLLRLSDNSRRHCLQAKTFGPMINVLKSEST
jgi:hypothetical protein